MDTEPRNVALPERVTAIVRISARARTMRLVALPGKGLELVVPTGTSPEEMRGFLGQHAAWAARTLRRLGAPMDARVARRPSLPDALALPAVEEAWRIVYVPGGTQADTVRLRFRHTPESRWIEIGHREGVPPSGGSVATLLRGYLRDRAKHVLPPWVARVAQESGLPAPVRVRVALQRTVWGSRSANGTLSLSARLLFLEKELVRHVILHELCHAGHMHHGASFHRNLVRHDPQASAHRRALRAAERGLPVWCSE